MSASPEIPGIPPRQRKPPRVMAKLHDAGLSPSGQQVARYICKKCGWDSDWVNDDRSDSLIIKGIPCEVCNDQGDEL